LTYNVKSAKLLNEVSFNPQHTVDSRKEEHNIMGNSYPKLRGKIVEKFGNYSNFSEVINKSKQEVSMKLNAKRGFTRADILSWCAILDIDRDQIGEYFF